LVTKDHLSILFVPISANIRGIVLYFHKNTLGKWNGPSDKIKEYQSIAGLYASQGYAVLIPDLLGYRSDTDPRPFLLYPQVSVRSAVSTLNQLVPFLHGIDGFVPNLYAVGYGEGGSYAAWLSKCVSFPDQC
jgi:dienelactone hydrolase